MVYAICLCVVLLVGLVPAAQAQLPTTLTWDYKHPRPQYFIVQRSLDRTTWEDIVRLPGERGMKITWHDTTLPVLRERTVVYYRVLATRGQLRSAASNVVAITVGPPPPGTCLTETPEPKMTITVCSLP